MPPAPLLTHLRKGLRPEQVREEGQKKTALGSNSQKWWEKQEFLESGTQGSGRGNRVPLGLGEIVGLGSQENKKVGRRARPKKKVSSLTSKKGRQTSGVS